MPSIGIKSSAASTLALVAVCVTTAWSASVSAQVRVASCADISPFGADLTSNPSFNIELQRDPATADGNARLAFTLEQADNNEVSVSINGGQDIVLDDVNAGGFEYARAYYFDFDRDVLNPGTNTVSFEYTPGNGAVLRRLCVVLRDPAVPEPRPLEEIYCSSRPDAYNAVTGAGPSSLRVDNMDWDNAQLTIPEEAITPTSVIGLFGAVRANGADSGTTRTFHFRNDENTDAEIVVDYSGIEENETALLFAATNVTGFFPDSTPDLSMTSSHSANVHELCVVVSNDGPEPEPEPTPDAGVEIDGGQPVDGGGPPDGGEPPAPDPEPSGGPGTPTPDTPTPDTPTPDTPTPGTPTPDTPTPDTPTPDTPTPDTPTPDATPGVTPGPNVGEPSPRPESEEPEGNPDGEVDNPLGQGFSVSSCASSSAPGSVPYLFSLFVFAAYGLSRRRRTGEKENR